MKERLPQHMEADGLGKLLFAELTEDLLPQRALHARPRAEQRVARAEIAMEVACVGKLDMDDGPQDVRRNEKSYPFIFIKLFPVANTAAIVVSVLLRHYIYPLVAAPVPKEVKEAAAGFSDMQTE